MKILNYRIFLRKEPEGGYTVTVPSLPGCVTYGENIEDAKKMAKEAIELYIETLQAHGTLSEILKQADIGRNEIEKLL